MQAVAVTVVEEEAMAEAMADAVAEEVVRFFPLAFQNSVQKTSVL